VTSDPDELDPELDAEIGVEDDLDEDLDDELPDGFVVEGEDVEDEAVVEDDEGSTVEVEVAVAAVVEDPDEFEEELAAVVRVPDEEDDAPARRAGEFICTRCFLVKRDSQLAVRSRKVCRDCA
jgi:hypothetical protein